MKKITVNDKYGNEYVLEYTRDTVIQLERSGFDISSVEAKPMTSVHSLFAGAFLANHKNTKPTTIDEIYDGLSDKGGLLNALVELYNEPLEALMEEPEQGNAMWKANW